MVSPETIQPAPNSPAVDPASSPARISFSADFLDENNFISICPTHHNGENHNNNNNNNSNNNKPTRNPDFEFLSGITTTNMLTADELFSEGKLLPFWQAQQSDKLDKITLKTNEDETHQDQTQTNQHNNNNDNDNDIDRRISWFLDDDPSPRPPKCTVLWKELLRLKKQRASTLSPSSSSSSSSSGGSLADISDHEKKKGNKEKVVNRVKKGLERTRSASIRIRPMVNVPICTHGKSNSSSLQPLFSMRRSGRLD